MMKTYRIENLISGQVLGEYRGASELEAYTALCRDAGYASPRQAFAVAPFSASEIVIIEVATGAAMALLA